MSLSSPSPSPSPSPSWFAKGNSLLTRFQCFCERTTMADRVVEIVEPQGSNGEEKGRNERNSKVEGRELLISYLVWRKSLLLGCNMNMKKKDVAWRCTDVKHQGPSSRNPQKLFVPEKPFLVHLYLKAEKCMRPKLLVWKEPLFILKGHCHNDFAVLGQLHVCAKIITLL